jgi:hypothetical protein
MTEDLWQMDENIKERIQVEVREIIKMVKKGEKELDQKIEKIKGEDLIPQDDGGKSSLPKSKQKVKKVKKKKGEISDEGHGSNGDNSIFWESYYNFQDEDLNVVDDENKVVGFDISYDGGLDGNIPSTSSTSKRSVVVIDVDGFRIFPWVSIAIDVFFFFFFFFFLLKK